jgi:hydrogenase nickel incorporation protein HypA/HybF
MHELSIAMSILEVAEEEAERCNLQVVAIRLRLGAFAGVVKEALLSSFEMARENSSMPDAELIIEDVPIVVYCPACQKESPAASMQEICCPICGTPTPDLVHGRELEVSGLEVRDDAPEVTPVTPETGDTRPSTESL